MIFKKLAFNLLETDQIQLVIGYLETSNGKVRPAFVRNTSDIEKLVFNNKCVQNLAVYLTKKEYKSISGIAIIATLPVLRTIIQLAKEQQLDEKKIKVIGILPSGEAVLFNGFNEIEELVNKLGVEINEKFQKTIDTIKALPREERWKYWLNELSVCFKCYACRAACPLCYCTKCIVESNQPQWIPASSKPLSNLEWHINRAMHMAGRCIKCDACAEACPLGIPINLITRNMISHYEAEFGAQRIGIREPNLLSTFNPSDKENFIR